MGVLGLSQELGSPGWDLLSSSRAKGLTLSLFVFILGLPGAEGIVEGDRVRLCVGLVGCGACSPILLFPLLAPPSLSPAAHGNESAAGGTYIRPKKTSLITRSP